MNIYENHDCYYYSKDPRYKLNDWIYHEWGSGKQAIELWTKSIAGQYNISKRKTERTKIAESNIHFSVGQIQHDILANCVNDVLQKFEHLFCKEKNCCIHLRFGDAMNPYFWKNEHHDYSYAPFKEEVVYEHVKKSIPEDYAINIIYSSSAGGTKITEDMIKSSDRYVENLINLLKKHYQKINIFNNSHPDIDFCRAINSDIFVTGVGGFTNLITSHRDFRKLHNVMIKGEKIDGTII